eukprot:5175876-Pleurochrysis_carterae.AAC.1
MAWRAACAFSRAALTPISTLFSTSFQLPSSLSPSISCPASAPLVPSSLPPLSPSLVPLPAPLSPPTPSGSLCVSVHSWDSGGVPPSDIASPAVDSIVPCVSGASDCADSAKSGCLCPSACRFRLRARVLLVLPMSARLHLPADAPPHWRVKSPCLLLWPCLLSWRGSTSVRCDCLLDTTERQCDQPVSTASVVLAVATGWRAQRG